MLQKSSKNILGIILFVPFYLRSTVQIYYSKLLVAKQLIKDSCHSFYNLFGIQFHVQLPDEYVRKYPPQIRSQSVAVTAHNNSFWHPAITESFSVHKIIGNHAHQVLLE